MNISNFLTIQDRAEALNKIKELLIKDLYMNLLVVGVDPDSFDYTNEQQVNEATATFENIPRHEHLAKMSVARNVDKLKVVINKIEELENA
jgi:hypothetical protein